MQQNSKKYSVTTLATYCYFILISGQRLVLATDEYIGGSGTYCRQGYIMSCLAGFVKIAEQPDSVN